MSRALALPSSKPVRALASLVLARLAVCVGVRTEPLACAPRGFCVASQPRGAGMLIQAGRVRCVFAKWRSPLNVDIAASKPSQLAIGANMRDHRRAGPGAHGVAHRHTRSRTPSRSTCACSTRSSAGPSTSPHIAWKRRWRSSSSSCDDHQSMASSSAVRVERQDCRNLAGIVRACMCSVPGMTIGHRNAM